MFTIFRQGKVPDMLFSTTELPPDIRINGKGCLLQGRYEMYPYKSYLGNVITDSTAVEHLIYLFIYHLRW
jgi:hypothetical protein